MARPAVKRPRKVLNRPMALIQTLPMRMTVSRPMAKDKLLFHLYLIFGSSVERQTIFRMENLMIPRTPRMRTEYKILDWLSGLIPRLVCRNSVILFMEAGL
jgi:hypothetical protein